MEVGCIGAFIPSTCSKAYGSDLSTVAGEYNDIHYAPAAFLALLSLNLNYHQLLKAHVFYWPHCACKKLQRPVTPLLSV